MKRERIGKEAPQEATQPNQSFSTFLPRFFSFSGPDEMERRGDVIASFKKK